MPETTPFVLPSVTAEEALAKAHCGALLIDLRKAEKVAADGRRVRGAAIRDPYRLDHDDPLTHDTRPLIVFCQKGEEVGQFGCAFLMLHGRNAAYVAGGFDAMVAAGIETLPAGRADDDC